MQKFLAKLAFYTVAVLTMAWTVSLTYRYLSFTLAMDPISTAAALAIFDVGTIAWMLVFMRHAEGSGQRGLAVTMTVVDLAGVGLMTFAEIFIGSGQSLVVAPAQLGEWSLWGIGIWTFLNAAAIIAYHLLAPENLKAMRVRGAQDKVVEETLRQLDDKTADIAGRAADVASERLLTETLRQLGISETDLVSAPRLPAARQTISLNGVKPAAFAAEAPAGPKAHQEE